MDRLLRIHEVAAHLSVHPRTVRRWLEAGKLPYRRLPGGERRIPLEVLRGMIATEPESASVDG
jgi:excisionase family DNA binding protein